jgi:hypothetical protein
MAKKLMVGTVFAPRIHQAITYEMGRKYRARRRPWYKQLGWLVGRIMASVAKR